MQDAVGGSLPTRLIVTRWERNGSVFGGRQRFGGLSRGHARQDSCVELTPVFGFAALTFRRSVRLGLFGTGIPQFGLKPLDLVAERRFDVPVFLGRSQRDLRRGA